VKISNVPLECLRGFGRPPTVANCKSHVGLLRTGVNWSYIHWGGRPWPLELPSWCGRRASFDLVDLAVCNLSARHGRGATRGGGGHSGGGHFGGGHPFGRHSGEDHRGGHFGWLHFGFGSTRPGMRDPEHPLLRMLHPMSRHTCGTSPRRLAHHPFRGFRQPFSGLRRYSRAARPPGFFLFFRHAPSPRFSYNRRRGFSSSGCFINGVTQVCFFEPFLPLCYFSGGFDPFIPASALAKIRLLSGTASIHRNSCNRKCPRSRPRPIPGMTTPQKGVRRRAPEPSSVRRRRPGPGQGSLPSGAEQWRQPRRD